MTPDERKKRRQELDCAWAMLLPLMSFVLFVGLIMMIISFHYMHLN